MSQNALNGIQKDLNRYLGISSNKQGMDSSARKPTLIQDTDYMVLKNYHLAPYLGTSRPI